MSIKTMKERREQLWTDLHSLQAEYKPKEDAIRAEIKEIQEELFSLEMTPVMLTLRNKVSAGEATEAEAKKLDILEAKLSL